MAYNFNMSCLILTKLGHSNPYFRAFMSHDQLGVKCQIGVENAAPPTNFAALSCDSCM